MKYDNYPESCPPIYAKEMEGLFYRLCKNQLPCENDFKTHYESGKKFPDEKSCEAMALSFFKEKEQANKLRKKFKYFKNHSIVPIKLSRYNGLCDYDEISGHLNLWEYRDINIYEEFAKNKTE